MYDIICIIHRTGTHTHTHTHTYVRTYTYSALPAIATVYVPTCWNTYKTIQAGHNCKNVPFMLRLHGCTHYTHLLSVSDDYVYTTTLKL